MTRRPGLGVSALNARPTAAINYLSSQIFEFSYIDAAGRPMLNMLVTASPSTTGGREVFPPRLLTATTIPAMIGAALTLGTASASAESTDDAFIAQMHKLGFTWQAEDEAELIAAGHRICAARGVGRTPDAIAQDIHAFVGSEDITFADVTSMVSAAESNYCPD